MKYAYPVAAGLCITLLSLFAPVLVLLALPLITWDKTGLYGRLPVWLRWLETPDNRLPCDVNVPAAEQVLNKYGRYVASWYWLGLRNRLHGLGRMWGREVTHAFTSHEGYQERGELWYYETKLGRKLRFACGWRVYSDGVAYWAAPMCTIKLQ